jgi:hypothetical protein
MTRRFAVRRNHGEDGTPSIARLWRRWSGNYQNEVMALTIRTDGTRLTLELLMKPEIHAAADKALPPGYPTFDFGLLPVDTDEFFITSGALNGQRGFFTLDSHGSRPGWPAARHGSRAPQ